MFCKPFIIISVKEINKNIKLMLKIFLSDTDDDDVKNISLK